MASRKSERILLNRWCEMGKKKASSEIHTVSSSEDSDHTPLIKKLKKSKPAMEGASREANEEPKESSENTEKKKEIPEKKKEISEKKKEIAEKRKETTKKKKVVADKETPARSGKLKEKSKSKEKALVIAENQEPLQKTIKKSEQKGKGKAMVSGKTKTSTTPNTWFISSDLKDLWENGYEQNTISHCNWVEPALMGNLSFEYIEKFKASSLMSMMNPSDIAYPRLTRLFYLNMSEVNGSELAISTRVLWMDIVLNHAVFSKVLNCPEKYDTSNHPEKKECLRLAKEKFFIPGIQHTSRQLTHSVLTVEAKILFTIIMRCIVPKENSKELLTDKVLILMYLIVEGYEIDLPSIVMEHMLSCSTKKRNHVLPYGNLLPLFFKALKVPLGNELRLSHMSGMITESTLQRIGIVRTKEGIWKFYTELTASELKAKNFVKPKAQTLMYGSSSSKTDQATLLEEIGFLREEMAEIRESQLSIESNMKRMSFTVLQNNENILKILHAMGLDGIETSQKEEPIRSSGSTKELFDENSDEGSDEFQIVARTEKEASKGSDQDKEEQGKQKKRKLDEVSTEEPDQGMEIEVKAGEEGKGSEENEEDAEIEEASSEENDEATP